MYLLFSYWFGTANGQRPFVVQPNQSVHGKYNLISVSWTWMRGRVVLELRKHNQCRPYQKAFLSFSRLRLRISVFLFVSMFSWVSEAYEVLTMFYELKCFNQCFYEWTKHSSSFNTFKNDRKKLKLTFMAILELAESFKIMWICFQRNVFVIHMYSVFQ